MKKILLVLLIILLVGCKNKNEMQCVRNYQNGDASFEEKVVANLEDGKVKSVKSTITFDSEETADSYCDAIKNYNKYYDLKLDLTCNKKTIVIANYEKYDEAFKDVIGLSKDEFKNLFTEYKYACK